VIGLPQVLEDIGSKVMVANFEGNADDKDEALFLVKKAREAIWPCARSWCTTQKRPILK